MKKFIIDRFEGNKAICELDDKTMISISINLLPLDCKEGDCLIMEESGIYHKDEEAQKFKKRSILERMNQLFK